VNARVALAALLLAGAAAATKMDPVPVASSAADAPGMTALDLRLKRLESELRCLVCQNQTLADSNADLADDLRREVRELALAGKTDAEIKAYLVTRYGDFVLYDPPLKAVTSLLWLGPFALLVGGGALWWVILRRRERGAGASAATLTKPDKASETRARKLLDDEDDAPE
jgi:cytochrome c-type biogenesis protein CcmH